MNQGHCGTRTEPANNVFMKAMVVTQFGGPEVLKRQEASMPAPGAHDLLIEAHACGLNPIDFKVRRGALAKDRPQPIILGFDVSGVVREMGKAVSDFRAVDEVYSAPSRWQSSSDSPRLAVVSTRPPSSFAS